MRQHQQVAAMLRKNFDVLMRNRRRAAFCYIYVPIGMVALVMALFYMFFNVWIVHEPKSIKYSATSLVNFTSYSTCSKSVPSGVLCGIGIAPSFNSSLQNKKDLPTDVQLDIYFSWLDIFQSMYPHIHIFPLNSSDDLQSSWDDHSLPIWAGIVFDSSQYPVSIQYDIRLASAFLPAPLQNNSAPSLFIPSLARSLYGSSAFDLSGFSSLQLMIDSSISTWRFFYGNISSTTRTSYSNKRNDASYFVDPSLVEKFGLKINATNAQNPAPADIPATAYVFIPAYLAWCFLGAVSMAVSENIQERISRMKEYLKIMGLSEAAFWTSHFITLLILVCPATILTIIGALATGFFGNNQGIGVAIVLCHAFSASSFGMLVAAIAPSVQAGQSSLSLFLTFQFIAATLVNVPLVGKIFMALISSVNFQFCLIEIVRERLIRDAGPIRTIPSAFEALGEWNFGLGIAMFFLDSIIYLFLAWYLAQVVKTSDDKFGARKPWHFIFHWDYWFPHAPQTGGKESNDSIHDEPSSTKKKKIKNIDGHQPLPVINHHLNLWERDWSRENNPDYFEPYNSESSSQFSSSSSHDHVQLNNNPDSSLVIKIDHLKKIYAESQTPAVNGISLDIHQGIFVLIGENGSGKSTLISMLTGLLHHTSGRAEILGYDLETQMDLIRQNISICPQHDLLNPNMTGYEHLKLFARLKGVSEADLEGRIRITLEDVGLSSHEHKIVKDYSGGMKRSLSLGISLVGNTKLVFIDEASSGMDVQKRRSLWNMFNRKKNEGLTIVLTTHYMEEAENLGDRIGMMYRGNLVREGTLEFLKRQLAFNISASDPIPSKNKPSSSNGENSSSSNDLKVSSPSSYSETLPLSQRSQIAKKLSRLEKQFENVSVHTPSLEDVFLSICNSLEDENQRIENGHMDHHQDENKHKSNQNVEDTELVNLTSAIPTSQDSHANMTYSTVPPINLPSFGHPQNASFQGQMKAFLKTRVLVESRQPWTIAIFIIIPVLLSVFGLLVSIMANGAMNEMPAALKSIEAAAKLEADFAIPQQILPLLFPYTTSNGQPFNSFNLWYPNIQSLDFGSSNQSLIDFLWFSNSSQYKSIPSQTTFDYGGYQIFFNDSTINNFQYGVTFNQTEVYSLPRMTNFMNNLLMILYLNGNQLEEVKQPLITIDATNPFIRTRSVPFEIQDQNAGNNLLLSRLTKSLVSLDTQFAMQICFTFAVLGGIISRRLVQEKEWRIRMQMRRAGLNIFNFWFFNFLFESIRLLLISLLILIVIACFQLQFLHGSFFFILALALWLVSICSVSIIFLVSSLFSNAQYAETFVPLLIILILLIPYALSSVFSGLEASPNLTPSQTLAYTRASKYIPFISPFALFAEIVTTLGSDWASNQVTPSFRQELAFTNLGSLFLMLGIHFIIWPALLVLKEYLSSNIKLSSSTVIDQNGRNHDAHHDHEISDPDEFKILVHPTNRENEIDSNKNHPFGVEMDGIWKRYKSGKRNALENVSFAIPRGSIWGFLGPNGAGKSTMIGIMTGDVSASKGNYWIDEVCALEKTKDEFYSSIRLAACLQTDSLIEHLTVKEHLEFFLRLRNKIEDEGELEQLIVSILIRMKLDIHQNKLSQNLSGGNKRKLCTALALLCLNSVVFLDEPSTGCDPSMRRNLWKIIHEEASSCTDFTNTVNPEVDHKKTIILTTHSMDEADAVCENIAIVVNGKIVSNGTPTSLKMANGGNYELRVWFPKSQSKGNKYDDSADNEEEEDPIGSHNPASVSLLNAIKRFEKQNLSKSFPEYEFVESEVLHDGTWTAKFLLGKTVDSLSSSYKTAETWVDQKVITDYIISQTSLETAYNRAVKHQVEDPKEPSKSKFNPCPCFKQMY